MRPRNHRGIMALAEECFVKLFFTVQQGEKINEMIHIVTVEMSSMQSG